MTRGYWGTPGAEPFSHHMSGASVAGMILMIILWIAVIAAIVIGIRALVLHSRRDKAAATTAAVAPAALYSPAAPSPAAAPSLLAILEERYARGDIGREEFLQRKQDLGLAGPVVAPTTETAATAPESAS